MVEHWSPKPGVGSSSLSTRAIIMQNDFINKISKQFGDGSFSFLEAMKLSPFVSIRKNPSKSTAQWNNEEKVPWCAEGYYLPEKPIYTLDPLFHAGCYYPQEASSMFIDWILRQLKTNTQNPVILDLCAAPGGKSTLISTFLNGKGLLIANEIIKNRSHILLENMTKWGNKNCIITQNSPADFHSLRNFFDIILVDAPCSGEGMFRKDKRAIEEWSENNAAMCAVRQQKILTDIWHSLKPDGFLIYCTCTFNPSENEENIALFAKEKQAEILPLTPPDTWGITSINISNGNGLAFYPHLTKGEGFFVAVLKKMNDKKLDSVDINKKNNSLFNTKYNNIFKPKSIIHLFPKIEISSILKSIDDMNFYEEKNIIRAFPKQFSEEFITIKNRLNVIEYGLRIGETSQKGFIPEHSLAMSSDFCNQRYPELELEIDEALKYLKGETLRTSGFEKGYLLLKYKGISLGFGKEIGTRINNLYPLNWRIRMQV